MKHLRNIILSLIILVLLFYYRILIAIHPITHNNKRLSISFSKNSRLNQKKQLGYGRKIGRIVAFWARYTPCESKCLVQALTTKKLLRLWCIPNTMYLGVNIDEQKKLLAHAWVDVFEYSVIGGSIKNEYKIIKSYADQGLINE